MLSGFWQNSGPASLAMHTNTGRLSGEPKSLRSNQHTLEPTDDVGELFRETEYARGSFFWQTWQLMPFERGASVICAELRGVRIFDYVT